MGFNGINPLVMTNIAMVFRWPLKMDDFPSYKPPFMVGIFQYLMSTPDFAKPWFMKIRVVLPKWSFHLILFVIGIPPMKQP